MPVAKEAIWSAEATNLFLTIMVWTFDTLIRMSYSYVSLKVSGFTERLVFALNALVCSLVVDPLMFPRDRLVMKGFSLHEVMLTSGHTSAGTPSCKRCTEREIWQAF